MIHSNLGVSGCFIKKQVSLFSPFGKEIRYGETISSKTREI